MLKTEKVSFKIGKKILLKETSVQFHPSNFHVIMGANGAGKSTLLKLLAGDQQPSKGIVFLNQNNLASYTKNELAKRRAVLSQTYSLSFSITVEEIVLMGRYPFFAMQPTAKDLAICRESMKKMDVLHLAGRDYTTLSGGEAQKVQMSRVLAQIWATENDSQQKILFLDEPISHLDIKYQYQLLQLAKELSMTGTTVIAVLHDLNLAIQFADRLLLMKEGAILYDITDASQLTPAIITEIFAIDGLLLKHTASAKPFIVFNHQTEEYPEN